MANILIGVGIGVAGSGLGFWLWLVMTDRKVVKSEDAYWGREK